MTTRLDGTVLTILLISGLALIQVANGWIAGPGVERALAVPIALAHLCLAYLVYAMHFKPNNTFLGGMFLMFYLGCIVIITKLTLGT